MHYPVGSHDPEVHRLAHDEMYNQSDATSHVASRGCGARLPHKLRTTFKPLSSLLRGGRTQRVKVKAVAELDRPVPRSYNVKKVWGNSACTVQSGNRFDS